ncbi:ATP-binding protein [Patescibacteria group bacterium]|nr:ATP-binding protein [Patescibacteria group bacterium]
MLNVRDIIAPSAIEVDFNDVRIGEVYYRTFFVSGYPRFVGANWLSPVINFDHTLLISMFYYPVKSKVILDDLRRKITELEATTLTNRDKGKITDPVVEAALEDANALQEQLVKGVEKYFQFSFYITIPAYDLEELENVTSKMESLLSSLLLISKTAALQMEDAFRSTIPTGMDKLLIARNMDTTSLATTFPFTSSDLTMEEGIMYGINKHNGSLVIFDRFSLENANSVVFAKSGAGKSYFVKLEALRHLVFGAQVMIIDPEEEYYNLCEIVGGNYINFSANSKHKINPFDLSGIVTEGENELGQKLISLITLLKLMMGSLTSTEEAILDRALIETYRIKGITSDPETQATKEPPVMEDLYKVLLGGSEGESKSMADRLEKFIKGSMTGIFDSQSNINLESNMTVFSTKNLEEALRPIAFYMILDFVWTTIRRDLRKRILIVEEAWYLMQNNDSARFIYGIAKRARKYYLGLTTISQDVDDFLTSEYGKAVVTNSSIQMLLKQHPAAIDKVVETFYLSEGEKRFLLSAGIGEGLFFAGSNHVAVKVMASEAENKLITTNPEEMLRLREDKRKEQSGQLNPTKESKPVYKPYVPPAPMDEYSTFDEKDAVEPDPQVKKIMSDVVSEDFVESESEDILPPEIPITDYNDNKDSGTIDIKPVASNSPDIPPEDKKNNVEDNTDTPKDFVKKPDFPESSDKFGNENKPESTSGGIPDSAINSSKPGVPTSTPAPTNENNKPLDNNPTHKPNLQQKKPLDSRVVELRNKMLGDEDGFLNNSPSAGDILDSVEDMRKQKQGTNSQTTTENLNNPVNADRN